MCEQLFLFGIKPKEKEPPKERQKQGYELLYSLMSELYNLTIRQRLKDVKYYIEDDTQYAEINGTQDLPINKRIDIYKKMISQIKNRKHFRIYKYNKVIINGNLG